MSQDDMARFEGKVDWKVVERIVRSGSPDASEREIFARTVLAATWLNGDMNRRFFDLVGTEILRQDFALILAAYKLTMEKAEREGPGVQ